MLPHCKCIQNILYIVSKLLKLLLREENGFATVCFRIFLAFDIKRSLDLTGIIHPLVR